MDDNDDDGDDDGEENDDDCDSDVVGAVKEERRGFVRSSAAAEDSGQRESSFGLFEVALLFPLVAEETANAA